MSENKLVFAHLRVGPGAATLAARLAFGRVTVAAALCSPRDQYSRKLGRTIASGRLEARRSTFAYERNLDVAFLDELVAHFRGWLDGRPNVLWLDAAHPVGEVPIRPWRESPVRVERRSVMQAREVLRRRGALP